MSTDNPTMHVAQAGRTMAALSLALASGKSLSEVDIDLTNGEQCRFGAYTLVEFIGGGGMGIVYRAHQASLERDVAIKLLNIGKGDNAEALERFRFEAKSAAALNHPNIVQVLEIGQEQGIAFIAMQLVRGKTLADLIVKKTLSAKDAVAIMLKLCDAVGYAHRLRLLHLDLKPANVLIDERGEPLVADFGLARRMNAQGQVQAQEVSGTPGYMAPEQLLIREFRLSSATDIYALGAILYETLCGQAPHGRGAVAEVMQRALAGQIPSPRQFNATIPRDLEAICMKCLSLRAADRYPAVEELADDLRRFANGLPVSARNPTWRERMERWYAREPKFAGLLALLLLLAVTGSIVFANLYRKAEFERAGAEGLVRVIMSQTPAEANPILPSPLDWYRVPVFDCTYSQVSCGGGLDPNATIDHSVPPAKRLTAIQSLRNYVPKIAAWGNARLSAQLAERLDGMESGNYFAERARAAASTDSTNGLLFAYLLMHQSGDPGRDSEEALNWFGRALAKTDQPWQAQMLAQSCSRSQAKCKTAWTRFRDLDPDNAAAWMTDIPEQPGDDGDRLLQRAAHAPRLDNHILEFIDAARAFAAALMPTLRNEWRLTPDQFVLEAWAPTGNIVYGELFNYCKKSFLERDLPSIEDACRAVDLKISPQMRPSLQDEFIGAANAKKMSSDPVTQAQSWRRLKDARWVFSAWKQLPPGSQADATTQVKLMRDRGEYAYIQSLVAKAGLPLEAPAEFVTREPLPWNRSAAISTQRNK